MGKEGGAQVSVSATPLPIKRVLLPALQALWPRGDCFFRKQITWESRDPSPKPFPSHDPFQIAGFLQ